MVKIHQHILKHSTIRMGQLNFRLAFFIKKAELFKTVKFISNA